jgi:glyoxylase-like metal-dependent hydrolase (beta-lactamase superfamily II)
LNANADIHFLDEKDHPYPEIQVKRIGGHTEFSQVLLFDDGDQKYLMAGDVLATRGEVNRNFKAKYDFDAETSLKKRQELTQKAYKEDYTILGYHDNHHPIFRLTDYNEKKGYTIKNIDK